MSGDETGKGPPAVTGPLCAFFVFFSSAMLAAPKSTRKMAVLPSQVRIHALSWWSPALNNAFLLLFVFVLFDLGVLGLGVPPPPVTRRALSA